MRMSINRCINQRPKTRQLEQVFRPYIAHYTTLPIFEPILDRKNRPVIEQVSVPNYEAIVAKRLEHSRAKVGYIPSLKEQVASENEIFRSIKEAQDKLNALLAEGYKVIAFTPFLIGHGTNFVLYKTDPVPALNADVPIETTTVPDHRQTILSSEE